MYSILGNCRSNQLAFSWMTGTFLYRFHRGLAASITAARKSNRRPPASAPDPDPLRGLALARNDAQRVSIKGTARARYWNNNQFCE